MLSVNSKSTLQEGPITFRQFLSNHADFNFLLNYRFCISCFFDSAYMPLVWLTAYISPIYKKGGSSEACNYRPISLTCTMCKIMEVTVKDHVMKYLLSKGLISNKQHAFIAKHSTVTNLLECIRMIGLFHYTVRHLLMLFISIFRVHSIVWYIQSCWLS